MSTCWIGIFNNLYDIYIAHIGFVEPRQSLVLARTFVLNIRVRPQKYFPGIDVQYFITGKKLKKKSESFY